MKNLRLGVIGLGNMGKFHADYLVQNKVARCTLTALASSSLEKLGRYPDVRHFTTGEELISSGTVDAVLIATPHYSHTTFGIAAFEAGLHVLVEKPISVHKADAERLMAAATRSGGVFAAMFQLRTEPRYQKLKKLIEAGELGEIVRVNWIITDWFRTESYYASGGWRATWRGEGGGALLNQCPHQIDLMHWLCGTPRRVRGFCQFGRYHDIEVEDNVTVFFEFDSGATGLFVTSTGEAPGTNRFEIAGTRGRVVLENGRLCFTRNESDMRTFSKVSSSGFAKPEVWNIDIPSDNASNQHAAVVQNFVEAILDGAALLAPGSDGLRSVEFANAALYSTWTDQTVTLPLDGALYEAALEEKIANSTHQKRIDAPSMATDFAQSFIR